MEKKKVLIADDEPEVLRIMEKKIAEAGFQVITSRDGEEAWEKIQLNAPDVILLDLTMPGLDGFSVLEKVRSQPPSVKWQPVIIVSAREELEDIKKGFSLDADHYITKPCQMEDIIKAIRMMLNLVPQRKPSPDTDS